MKCISLPYLIVVVIILMILSYMQSNATLASAFSWATTGAVVYYIAGFFLPCT